MLPEVADVVFASATKHLLQCFRSTKKKDKTNKSIKTRVSNKKLKTIENVKDIKILILKSKADLQKTYLIMSPHRIFHDLSLLLCIGS